MLDLFNQEMLMKALPYALQLSLLAYLDSLLTSLVIDRMAKERDTARQRTGGTRNGQRAKR
jgi:MFS superfamily sulfate permease-like transporter